MQDATTVRQKLTWSLVVIAVLTAIASSMPSVQNTFREAFLSPERQVLARLTGFYGIAQTEYLILKIKDESGLQIEIFEKPNDGSPQKFKQKFELIQDTDAYITIDKSSTNLALSDVNKDGQLEILAPSVDRNGNLRLNSFQFNSEFNTFEPLQETQ
jgi:hypothetical protein